MKTRKNKQKTKLRFLKERKNEFYLNNHLYEPICAQQIFKTILTFIYKCYSIAFYLVFKLLCYFHIVQQHAVHLEGNGLQRHCVLAGYDKCSRH